MYGSRREFLPAWLDPGIISAVVILSSLLLFTFTPSHLFVLEYRSAKVNQSDVLPIYMVGMIAIVAGSIVARIWLGGFSSLNSVSRREDLSVAAHGRFRVFGYVAAILSLSAYLVYFVLSDISLALVLASLSGATGASYQLKASMERVPGVTSLMSIAPWWFVYVFYKKFVQEVKLTRFEMSLGLVLLLSVILRAFAENERRAIIDLFIPAFLIVVMLKVRVSGSYIRRLHLLPIVAVVLLASVFLGTEYFRTWVNFHAEASGLSYWQWALVRLGGYYTTSINNGAGAYLADFDSGGYYLLHGVYRLPVISTAFGLDQIRYDSVQEFTNILTAGFNPEFNNQGGLIVAFWDLGVLGGSVILILFGYFASASYLMARCGHFGWLAAYPFFLIASLEITRIWYIGNSVGLINLMFVALMLTITNGTARNNMA